MYLTPACLIPWMTGRGLVDSADIVRGDLRIIEFERNNRCFQVLRRDATSYLIKQLRDLTDFDVSAQQREVAVYQLAASETRFAPLQQLLPTFVTADTSRYAIVLECLEDAEHANQMHNRIDTYPSEFGRQLGESLAVFHSELGREFAASMSDNLFPGLPPWIMSFHKDQGDGRLSPGNAQLLRWIQEDGDLTQKLDDLRASWQTDGLMHRDLKWNNILLTATNDSQTDLHIIDWEMADTGDWCWDAGMAIQNWWSFEAQSAPNDAPVDAEEFLTATSELAATRPAVREFWSSWILRADVADSPKAKVVTRCVQYAAARMLQTTYELLHQTGEMNDRASRLFQLSQYLLKSPEVAIAWLS